MTQFKKFLRDLKRIKLILSDLKGFINTHAIKLIIEEIFFCIYINDKQLLSKTQRTILKKARERFQNLSEQENEKGVKKAREKYHNLKKKKKEIVSMITIFLRIKNRSELII